MSKKGSKADLLATSIKWRFVRRAVIGGERSEGLLPALYVEICMAQHLSLSALC
jgi:hypothetical protein